MKFMRGAVVLSSLVLFPTWGAEPELYTDVIAPIFSAKCAGCHAALPARSHGQQQRIYQAIMLPTKSKGHMPPRDRPQLTSAEITAIQWWFGKGAPDYLPLRSAGTIPPEVRLLIPPSAASSITPTTNSIKSASASNGTKRPNHHHSGDREREHDKEGEREDR